MDNAPEVYGLTRAKQKGESVLSLPSLLRFKELDITHVSTGLKASYMWYGNELQIGHFDKVNKHSGYTAKNLLDDKHISLIQAHTHRLGSSYKTVPFGKKQKRVIVGFENGCLCDLNPEYVIDPNWQHGFSIVKKKTGGDRFYIQQIPIVDYVCFLGEKEWRG